MRNFDASVFPFDKYFLTFEIKKLPQKSWRNVFFENQAKKRYATTLVLVLAKFNAKYHGGTVSGIKNYGPMAGLAVTTAQTWVIKIKMCHFKAFFYFSYFF